MDKNISDNFLSLLDGLNKKPSKPRTDTHGKDKANSSHGGNEECASSTSRKEDTRQSVQGKRNSGEIQGNRGGRRGGRWGPITDKRFGHQGSSNKNISREFFSSSGDFVESDELVESGRKHVSEQQEANVNRRFRKDSGGNPFRRDIMRDKNRYQDESSPNDKDQSTSNYSDHQGSSKRKLAEPRPIRKMGYKFLESLLVQEPSFVVTNLASTKSGFQELINDRPIRPDLLMLIVRVLNKINESNIDMLKLQILSEVFSVEFIDEIKKFLASIYIEDHQNRIKSLPVFFSNIISLFDSVIDMFPSIMNEKLKSVIVALTIAMKHVKDELGMNINQELFDSAKSIGDQVNSYMEDIKKAENKRREKTTFKELVAPNNFRDIPLIPVKEDLMQDKPFLRQNVVRGGYSNVEVYLDVQFRLLREDFIAPLRAGIYEYIESLSGPGTKRRFTNVRIYPKVQFIESCKSRDTYGFVINFDCDKKLPSKMNWEFSKRFMVGSLLLFTDDHFQNFYLATVGDRDAKALNDRKLFVSFVPGTSVPDYLFQPGVYFVMAESEVYYEAYRHVLAALKRINEKNFPMKQYIVDVDTNCFPPAHITDRSVYNISDYKVNILDEDEWPTAEQLKLNPSQHKAFKSALTNEFAVIQGPPGTGKTFLALNITKVLLENKVSNTPIVVICYTNHALDQFLEGILKYTNKLIRIGSQSQNENLVEFNIDKIRRNQKEKSNRFLSDVYRKEVSNKYSIQEELENITRDVVKLDRHEGILNLEVLRSVVPPHHFNELSGNESSWLLSSDSPDLIFQTSDQFQPSDNVVTGQNQSQSADVSHNVPDLHSEEQNEEEMDEEENARRIADMTEDDFLFDDDYDLYNEDIHYVSKISYNYIMSTEIMLIDQQKYELEKKLKLKLHDRPNIDLVYFEQESKEIIAAKTAEISYVKNSLDRWRHFKFDPVQFEELRNTSSVWNINLPDRWTYYLTLVHLYICQLKQTLQLLTNRYQEVMQRLNELKQLEDLHFVREADIVGLTTSGAAKRRVLLENLGTKIVIIEEAAEVLEAHIVTSLAHSVQHVILIGDHKQLKPKPTVYELAKKYNMDISLFERMVTNGLSCSVLDVQHRMRPEISALICPTIYQNLSNHPSTFDRHKITGIDKFVFFLEHNHTEDQLADSSSKQNTFEADFLMELCNHLLLQGYEPDQITILTTYMGQVWYMRKEKRRRSNSLEMWKQVRVTSVDNFQGEENKIILLSLVRSNKEAKIGFLSTENRVCVALSRARDGLYVVGNMDNLRASSAIWPHIYNSLLANNAVGSALTLRCERHPDQVTAVSAARHFAKLPEGGCSLMCDTELVCGHLCPRKCHIMDQDHLYYKCKQPCLRPPCEVEGHKCPLLCWKPCEPCRIIVTKLLPCGHEADLWCHAEPAGAQCLVVVPATLPACGHTIDKLCYIDTDKCRCTVACPLRLPCGHSCDRNCHVTDDPEHLKYKCQKKCDKLNIGCRRNHRCGKCCYEECGDCVVAVEMLLECGHQEKIPCSTNLDTFQCEKRCKNTLPCGHPCPLQCWAPCEAAKCIVLVDKTGMCGHTFKKVKCSEPLENYPKCFEKCARKLPCGHGCLKRCSDDCSPVVCKQKVETAIVLICGHSPGQIPCHLHTSELASTNDELLYTCRAACGEQLACGHECAGSCGQCMQGRVHVPCRMKANRQLICGHGWMGKCSELWPRCYSKECLFSCTHISKCRNEHVCSKECERCTKPCIWSCKHHQCLKHCGELCERPPCNKACTQQLRCGHACVGFCGEVCPPLCRICHLEHPLIVANPNSRFVLLEDCNHVIEATHLQDLLDTVCGGSVIHRLARCPECDTPMVKTRRCHNTYIVFQENVRKIGELVNGEINHLKRIHARNIEAFQSCNLENSDKMKDLLLKCGKMFGGNNFQEKGRLIIALLLLPLAKCIQNFTTYKSIKSLLPFTRMCAIDLRLDYLAKILTLHFDQIGYLNIQQIELEVARIRRGIFDVDVQLPPDFWLGKYTWERDRRLGLAALPSLSSTIMTRDADRLWKQCDKEHFYVGDPCSRCTELAEEEEKRLQDEANGREARQPNKDPHDGYRQDRIPLPNFTRRGRGRGRGRGRRGRRPY